MLLQRRILLFLAAVLVLLPTTATVAWAVYLRSEDYRRRVEHGVSEFLGLPLDIDSVAPLTTSSRLLEGVRVWLPGRQQQIFESGSVEWQAVEGHRPGRNALLMRDGWLLLGTGEFSSEDYHRLLRGSLGHDFRDLNLGVITLEDMDAFWRQPEFQLAVTESSGEVTFSGDGAGRAHLVARRINGYESPEPIHVRAEFLPGRQLRFDRVELEVPTIPLAALGLADVVGGPISDGLFEGEVVYRETPSLHRDIRLRGAIIDARLEELTRRLPTGPLTGRVAVRLQEAVLAERSLESLEFSGELRDLDLHDLAPTLGEPGLAGRINLRLDEASYADGRLRSLSGTGEARGVPTAALARLIGRGEITGEALVVINSLMVVDERIRFADIHLEITPPAGEPGYIDRAALLSAADQFAGIDLGSFAEMLPERIEYTQLGCELIVNREELTVRGAYGENRDVILSVKLFGQEINLIRQPQQRFSLAHLVEAARERWRSADAQRLLRWLQQPSADDR